MAEELPPPVDAEPALKPVQPPPGSPDHKRRAGAKTDAAAEAPAAAAEAPVPPQVAVLEFRDPRSKTVPLDYPFTFEGRLFEAMPVRRLAVVEVDRLVSDGRHDDLYEILAVMTGVAAPVLRGMDADDSDRLIKESADFLPRWAREVFGLAPR